MTEWFGLSGCTQTGVEQGSPCFISRLIPSPSILSLRVVARWHKARLGGERTKRVETLTHGYEAVKHPDSVHIVGQEISLEQPSAGGAHLADGVFSAIKDLESADVPVLVPTLILELVANPHHRNGRRERERARERERERERRRENVGVFRRLEE